MKSMPLKFTEVNQLETISMYFIILIVYIYMLISCTQNIDIFRGGGKSV